MLVTCPKCGVVGDIPDDFAGRTVRCRCGHAFAVGQDAESDSCFPLCDASPPPAVTMPKWVIPTIGGLGVISLVSVAVALSFAFSRPKTPPQFPTPSSPATVVDSTANAVADDPPLDMETKQGPRDGFAWFDPTSKVGVVRYGWARGSYGSREISGTARNTSDVSYANVWINFNLEDASGAVVGNEVAGVDNLGPGKEWKFRTSVYEKKAVSATIVNIRISEH